MWFDFSIRKSRFTKTLIILLTILFFFAFSFFFWLPPLPSSIGPMDLIGSLHSVRYAWIANYILETNAMPVLAQNYAQSILAYATRLTGGAITLFIPLALAQYFNRFPVPVDLWNL